MMTAIVMIGLAILVLVIRWAVREDHNSLLR
jgi:hypothetical protein